MQALFKTEMPQPAVRFRDYIRGQFAAEVILRQERDARGTAVTAVYYDARASDFAAVAQEAQQFLQNPLDERYQAASWENGDTHTVRYERSAADSPAFWRQWRQTKFTALVTLICVLVYIFEWLGFDGPIMTFAHYPAFAAENSELWRYITHTLVHLSPLHILFNLSWWWVFGGAVERNYGSFSLMMLYLCAAVISGVAQNWASGPNFFGLSGVVYAVLGFVFIVDKFGETRGTVLPQGFFTMLVVGIAFGFISPLVGVRMGNAAHIAGLIVGLLIGFRQVRTDAARR